MICVVSVVDSISTTSMPVNEFVIYRSVHHDKMKQIMIVCDTKIPDEVMIPEDVEIYLVGNNIKKIRKAVRKIKREEQKNSIVYHMHHQKSALVFLAATIGMGVRKHTLYTIHSTYNSRNIQYRVSSCICSLLSRYANCVSMAAFNEYSRIIKKMKGKKFVFITNGVDVERIDESIKNITIVRDKKTMICVGRMIPLKNHLFLIRILKELPGYKLILVGTEDKAGSVRALAKQLKVDDRIEFTGLIPRDEVFKKLGSAFIYLSSSHVEGLPVSVLEAMRVGLIPFLSDIAPHKEIADQCPDVEILPLDEKVWIETINKFNLLADDKVKIRQDNLVKSVKEKFSLDTMHNQYMILYKKLV